VPDHLTATTDGRLRLRSGSELVAAHLDELEAQVATDVRAAAPRRVLLATIASWRTAVSVDADRLDRVARTGLDPIVLFAGPVPSASALALDERERARVVHQLVATGWLTAAPGAPGRYRGQVGAPIPAGSDPVPGRSR
jgi:hypothetical protein